MKEALIRQDLDVEIREIGTPNPGPGEVLIRIEVTGSNPKDWKNARISDTPVNSGDDMAGTVIEVGDGVVDFGSSSCYAQSRKAGRELCGVRYRTGNDSVPHSREYLD